MKGFILFLVFLQAAEGISQNHGTPSDFEKFKLKFPSVKLPLDTRSTNNDPMKIWSSKSSKLSSAQSIRFLLNGDSTKARYRFEKFDMMEGKRLGWAEREFNFYSIFCVETKRFSLLGFMKSDDHSYKCYVSIFLSNNFSFVGTLQVNEISENGDPNPYVIASVIDSNFVINTFKYENVVPVKNTQLSGEVNKTKITSLKYEVDYVNKKLVKLDSMITFSPCHLEDIYFKKRNCGETDPMNKGQAQNKSPR